MTQIGAGILLICSLAGAAQAQSLADAARKERDRQRTVQSKAVYSNESAKASIPAVPAPPSAESTTSSPASATSISNATADRKPEETAAPTGPTDSKGRDEKAWKATFSEARQELKRNEEKLQLAELKIRELNTQLLRQSDMYNRENRVSAELRAANETIETARRDVERSKQKIADLETELRRSGGPPGWAR